MTLAWTEWNGGRDEEWSNSEFILNVEPAEFLIDYV